MKLASWIHKFVVEPPSRNLDCNQLISSELDMAMRLVMRRSQVAGRRNENALRKISIRESDSKFALKERCQVREKVRKAVTRALSPTSISRFHFPITPIQIHIILPIILIITCLNNFYIILYQKSSWALTSLHLR